MNKNRMRLFKGLLIYGLFMIVCLFLIMESPIYLPLFILVFAGFHVILLLMDKFEKTIKNNRRAKFLSKLKEDFKKEECEINND